MMRKAGRSSLKYNILLMLLCSQLMACFGGGAKNSVQYYLVDPVVLNNTDTDTGKELAIELIDLHIPQYLQRFQLVTRDGDNRLRFSESNQWAENLRKNLLRTLAINLASRLATIDIGTPLNRSASLPDYRVQIHIGRFELDSEGLVQLSARWQISGRDEAELEMLYAELHSPERIQKGDYDKVVADMQTLFAGLCDQIAASINRLEGRH